MRALDALAAVAARQSAVEGAEWLRDHLGRPPFHVASNAAFGTAFGAAGRRVGKARVTSEGVAIIVAAGLLVPDDLGADECARGAMLLAELEAIPASEHVQLVSDLLRRGEVRERQAVLRVLAALPEPARFVDLAIDACRTNVADVFRAIACTNTYPAERFSEAAFNQMVLKALFIGAPLARVHGLAERTTEELVRMVEAFASERRAAGRPVPDDASLVITRR
jgi:hypothetical protein